jgi:hypothetical protein
MLRVEHCDGAGVPLYYFEAEGPGWSDYEDDEGIELQSDAKALAYAYAMVQELKADLSCSSRIGSARQFSALPSSSYSDNRHHGGHKRKTLVT